MIQTHMRFTCGYRLQWQAILRNNLRLVQELQPSSTSECIRRKRCIFDLLHGTDWRTGKQTLSPQIARYCLFSAANFKRFPNWTKP